MDNTCKECNESFDSAEFVRRHVKVHKVTFQKYYLKWYHNGTVPKCNCGCGKETSWNVARKSYAEHVLGHHAWGRKKSEDEKRRIGEKNSLNMKKYMKNNPDIAKLKMEQLLSGITPEVKARQAASVRSFWDSDSETTALARKGASDRAIELLEAGIIGPQAPYKSEWVYNPFTNKQEYMHSSWETIFLMKCIKSGPPITKSHSIRIPYKGPDKKSHVYVPDFVTLDTHPDRIIFEVKGVESDWDRIKEVAAKKWCDKHDYIFIKINKSHIT